MALDGHAFRIRRKIFLPVPAPRQVPRRRVRRGVSGREVSTEEMPPNFEMLDDRALAILAALVTIALKSRRREAEALKAANRAGFDIPRSEVADVIDDLEQRGLVTRVIHLSDGGILVLLTSRGIEALRNSAFSHVLSAAPAFSRYRYRRW